MLGQSDLFNEQNHLNDTGVSLYVDGLRLQREGELPDPLLDHVEACVVCREQVFDYFEFVKDDDLNELKQHPFFYPSNKKAKVVAISYTKIISLAASVLLLISFGAWFAQLDFNGPKEVLDIKSDSLKHQGNDTFPTLIDNKELITSQKQKEEKTPIEREEKVPKPLQQKKPKVSVSYDAIAYLDRQIDRGRRVRGLQVILPITDTTLYSGPKYQWTEAVSDSLVLEMFTKKTEKKPLVFRIAPDQLEFKVPQKLEPALYYWVLKQIHEGRQKRIGIGRFYIKPKV